MALSTPFSWRGVSLAAAYVRIRTVSVDLDARTGFVTASIYASSDARQGGAPEIDQVMASFAIDLQQPIAPQAYAALKALPSLSTATDV